ncbi:hypothetical protein ACHAWF_002152 [Thalassiosira exigua]
MGKRRFLFAVVVVAFVVVRFRLDENEIFQLQAAGETSRCGGEECAKSMLTPMCTENVSDQVPDPQNEKGHIWVQAGRIVAHLISRLHEMGAPVILMYGTLLYEHRNGTDHGLCLRLNTRDKDFDVAVFRSHFEFVMGLKYEIREKFGWEAASNGDMEQRLYVTFWPGERWPPQFQVDVYGFHCNMTQDLIKFPWDEVDVARDAFLPVKRHKSIWLEEGKGNGTVGGQPLPRFYVPHDPPCLLENIYGPDYMTPKSGATSQAKWGTVHGRPAHGNPECRSNLTSSERDELDWQLTFC